MRSLCTHVYCLQSVDFLKAYLKVGREYRIPVFIPRRLEAELNTEKDVIVDEVVTALSQHFTNGMLAFYVNSIKNLKPGLTYFTIHTVFDDEEMRAVTINHTEAWR